MKSPGRNLAGCVSPSVFIFTTLLLALFTGLTPSAWGAKPVGVLAVTPTNGLASTGTIGGPFNPSSQVYTLTNSGNASLDWAASKSQNWVSLSATSGTLRAGASTSVTVTINSNANSLAVGSYSDSVTFTNLTNGNGTTNRNVNLTVNGIAALAVSPAGGLTSSGTIGGPFSPSSQVYTLTNSGSATLNWSAGKNQNWLSLSATNGTLAVGAGTSVTVSINSNANGLAIGSYSDSVTFTNLTNGNGTTNRTVSLTVNQPPPVAGFSGSPTNGPVPLTVTFTDSSTGSITNRFWDFGDGSTSNTTATTVSKTYLLAGSYSVRLTAFGAGGSNMLTRANYITVTNPPCTFALSSTNATISASGGSSNVTINASGSNCVWSAASNNGFITITSATNVLGNGSVNYSVAANTNTIGRIGTMAIAGLTFTINQGKVIRVPTDQSTIQGAMNAALAGDTVLVSAGTYNENINFAGKNITVASASGPNVTIIDGQHLGTVVQFGTGESRAAALRGFTIRNGSGGGVYVFYASPSIIGNTIINNTGCDGIGVTSIFGSPLIQSNTISGNVRSGCSGGIGGGGIKVQGASSAEILDNVIANNTITGGDGGGISLFAAGTPTIRGNLISGNSASGISPCSAGGGIVMYNYSDALIVNNLIVNNSAGCGGGIYWLVPTGNRGPLLINNTLADNAGTQISANGFDPQTVLVNNIVIGNQGQAALLCSSSQLSHNDVFSPGANAYSGSCSNYTGVAGNISVDPLFLDRAHGNYRLQAVSPSIDAGDNSITNLPPTDLDGLSRVMDGSCDNQPVVDMGAFEFVPALSLSCPTKIVQNPDSNSCSAVVNYPLPASCGAVTLSCSPPPGSIFPSGITTVQCVATGVMNQVTSCSFTVTIVAAFTVSPTNVTVGCSAATNTVTVAGTNCSWTANSNDGFLTILSGATGAGNGTVTYAVAATTGAARSGTLTVAGKTVTVMQPNCCAFAISPTNATFAANGGSSNVTVNASGTNCAWTAASNASFITITSNTNGAGNGLVSYTVGANTNSVGRVGTMTIAGQTFTVNQSAAAASPPVADFRGSPTTWVVPFLVSFTNLTTGGASNTYSWAFGDGGVSSLPNPTYTYSNAGSYTVSLTAFSTAGTNTNSKTNYITAVSPPVADFSGTPTNGQAALTVTFTNLTTGGIFNSYYWTFGDGGVSSLPNPTHTYSNAGTYTVSLSVSTPNYWTGISTSTKSNYIVVSNPPAPVANFTGAPTNGPAPLTVTFTDSSTGSITNRNWSFGDGSTTNTLSTNLVHSYAAAGTNTVTLVASGPGGASTNTRPNYIVVAPFVAQYTITSLGTLGGTNSQAWGINNLNQIVGQANDSGNVGRAFLWQNGVMQQIAGCGNASSAVAINDNGVVLGWCGASSSTVTWSNGVMQSIPGPYPYDINNSGWIAGGNDCGNGAYVYNGTIHYFNLGGSCKGGHGINSAGTMVGGSWIASGVDHAFVVYNLSGAQDLGTLATGSSHASDINDAGDIVGIATPTNGQPSTLVFWPGGSGITNLGTVVDANVLPRVNSRRQIVGASQGHAFLWDNGVTSDLNNLVSPSSGWVLQYATRINDAGYIIGYGVTNGQTRAFLLVPTRLSASFSGTPTNGSAPLTVTFTDTSTGTITNRFWSFGDGTVTNTVATTLVHTYTVGGTNTVSLTVSGPDGVNSLSRTNYIVVSPPPPPVANFVGGPAVGAVPLAAVFTNLTTGGISNSYSWSFGDGGMSNLANPTYNYNNAGTYTVSLTAFSTAGTNTLTRTNYISAVNPLVADFSGTPTNGVAPLTVTFTNLSTGGCGDGINGYSVYSWSFGDGGVGPGPTHTYSNAGSYTVSLTAISIGNYNCGSSTNTKSNYIVVSNPPAPVASFTGSPTNGAAPLTVTFTDNSTGSITNRNWNFGDGSTTNTLSTNLVHSYAAAGTNTVSLTVSGSGGANSQTRTNYIVVSNAPPAMTNSWINPSSGKWEDGTSWSLTVPPSSTQMAILITNAGIKTVTIDATTTNTPTTMTINNLLISPPDRMTNTLFLNNTGTSFPLHIVNGFSLTPACGGCTAGGTLVLSNAYLRTDGQSRSNNVVDGSVTLLNSVAFLTNAQTLVGVAAQGQWTQTNSTTTAFHLVVGASGGNGRGSVTVSGGSLIMCGPGRIKPNVSDLAVGESGGDGNQLRITDGGIVVNDVGFIGSWTGNSNMVLVTGNGSVWSNATGFFLDGSANSSWNQLIISNGGRVYSGGSVDLFSAQSNQLTIVDGTLQIDGYCSIPWQGSAMNNVSLVSGSGAVWKVSADLDVGGDRSNQLIVTNNATLICSNLTISGETCTLAGGNVFVTNASSSSQLNFPNGSLVFNKGTITVDQFFMTNGTNSVFSFQAGLLNTKSTTVSNGQWFTVGNASASATLNLLGGTHSFSNGLQISTNSLLTGCGTVNGPIVNFGTITSNCPGGTTTFNGPVTNNATITVLNGGTFVFNSPTVNNGLIDGTQGTIRFNSTVINNGTILTNSPPIASFTGSPTNGAAPLTVGFTDSSTGTITNRSWNFGDGGSSSATNPSHTYTNAGTYSVSLTVWGPVGSNTLTRANYIIVINVPPPVAGFTGSPTNGAAPLTVNFTDASSGSITNRLWAFGDGGSSSATSPSHTYSNAGSYSVSLTVWGPGGSNSLSRASYISVTNSPPPPPVAGFSGTPTNGSAPLLVTFTNTSIGSITSNLWNFGDSASSTNTNPTHSYSNAGSYAVSLTAFGPGGSNTLTRSSYITVTNAPPPPPVANFTGAPTNGVAPLLVAFTNTSTGSITSNLWNFGDSGTSTNTNPTHTYSSAGSYAVSLTAFGPGGSNTLTRAGYITVSNAASTSATFVTLDSATQGTWKGVYGADGYNVIQDTVNYPAYAAVTTSGKANTLAASTTDVRALQKAATNATDRIAATWYANNRFTIDLNLTDGQTHRVPLYAMDWGNNNRVQTVDILDAATGIVLDSRSSGVLNGGIWLVWDIRGHVTIRVTNTAGSNGNANAVINGIFFQPPSNSLLAASSALSTTEALSDPSVASVFSNRIDSPTNGFVASGRLIQVSGSAIAPDAIDTVVISNSRGGSIKATLAGTNWVADNVALRLGSNQLVAIATDTLHDFASATVTVVRINTNYVNTTLATTNAVVTLGAAARSDQIAVSGVFNPSGVTFNPGNDVAQILFGDYEAQWTSSAWEQTRNGQTSTNTIAYASADRQQTFSLNLAERRFSATASGLALTNGDPFLVALALGATDRGPDLIRFPLTNTVGTFGWSYGPQLPEVDRFFLGASTLTTKSFQLSGTLHVASQPSPLSQPVSLGIGHYDEALPTAGWVKGTGNEYTYQRPVGQTGGVETMTVDYDHGTWTATGNNVDLNFLSNSPTIDIRLEIGDFAASFPTKLIQKGVNFSY